MDSFTIACDKMFSTEDGKVHFIEAMFSQKFELVSDFPEIVTRIHPAKKAFFDHLHLENQRDYPHSQKNIIEFSVNKSNGGSETIPYSSLANVAPKKVVREVEIEGFDYNANPVIRQLDTGSLRIVFCNLPPIAFAGDTDFDMDDFGNKLLNSGKAKITWEDRDVFYVSNPYPATIEQIQNFIQGYAGGKANAIARSNDQPSFCKRAIAYLKANVSPPQSTTQSINLSLEHWNFIDHLHTFYVVDEPQGFVFIQDHHLETEHFSSDAMRESGLHNLRALFEKELRIEKKGAIYAIFVEGNFEASGLLLDELWDHQLRSYISHAFVVAAPSRDVLAFCDSQSDAGIATLQEIVRRVYTETENPNHLLSQNLYQRIDGKWTIWSPAQTSAQTEASDALQQRLRANADKLRQLIKEKMNVELHYDAKSLAWINTYINKLSEKTELKNKESLIQLLVAFSGECFIQRYGGNWCTQETAIVLTFGDRTLDPFSLIRQQIHKQLSERPSFFKLYEAEAIRDQQAQQKRTHAAAEIPTSDRLDAVVTQKYRLTPPSWVSKDPLKTLFDNAENLLLHGRIVWATVIQANNTLFEVSLNTGLVGAPAELLYDPTGNASIEDMLPISKNILQLRSTKTSDAALKFIKDHLNKETTRLFGHLVPASISAHALRMSSTWIERSYFPQGVVVLPYLPVLISDDYPGQVLPVPSFFWRQDFKDQWLTRLQQAAPSATPQRYVPPAELAHLHPMSLVEEGAIYFVGKDIAQDYDKAKLAFEKAAVQGSSSAYEWLAKIYNGGFGVQKNLPHAALLRAKAAELSQQAKSKVPSTSNNLDTKTPESVLKEDREKSVDDPAHQFFLSGQAHYEGVGEIKSISKAHTFWMQAAKMGHRDSMYNLGCLYFFGELGKQDRCMAMAYFEAAAQLGCNDSKIFIADRRRTLLGLFEWGFRKKNLFEK